MWAFLNNISRNRRRGETLLEVLIALFVLGTTSAAATFLIIQSSRASLDIQKQFQARYLAREVFEHLKMVRNTNWIRFGDKSCWDIDFQEKNCSKQSPNTMVDLGQTKKFGLVSGKAGDMYMQLKEVTGNIDEFQQCEQFTVSEKSAYAVYRHEVKDEYEGIMYSPDPLPPAEQRPMFCRKIELTKNYKKAITAIVTVSWKNGNRLAYRKEEATIWNY